MPVIESRYQSALKRNSSLFSRPNKLGTQYYFELIEVTVSKNGTYTILADSNIATYYGLYNTSFDLDASTLNLIQTGHNGGIRNNFNLTMNLTVSQSVIVIAKTYDLLQTASFNITIYGPLDVSFKRKFSSWEYLVVHNDSSDTRT